MENEPLVVGKIESNGFKGFLSSFIGWAFPALILLGALFIVNTLVDFSIVFESLQFLGFNASADTVMQYLVEVIFFLVFIVSFYNTITAVMKRVDIFSDKLVCSCGFKREDVDMANIVKVNYTKKGISALFGAGSIIIETTGGKKEGIKLNYVSQPQERVVFFQSVLARYHYHVREVERLKMLQQNQSSNSLNI